MFHEYLLLTTSSPLSDPPVEENFHFLFPDEAASYEAKSLTEKQEHKYRPIDNSESMALSLRWRGGSVQKVPCWMQCVKVGSH